MTRIVERCPSCGVEHDIAEVGECEACGSPLRFWCRTHSREIGWLDGADCPRCPPGTARVKPRPTPAPPPSTRPAAPAAPRATATAAATAATPAPAPATPVTARTPPPPPFPAAAVPLPAPAAEDQPREEPVRRTAPGQGPIVRLFNAVLTTLQGGIVGVLLGVGAGGFQAFYTAGDIPLRAVEWGVYGGMAGLLLGGLAALGGLLGSPSPPER